MTVITFKDIDYKMSRQIKKSVFKYIKCAGGNLHDGQIMNLVCVDDKCQHRGIICPICKMESHEDHYILPIKSFLDQIDELFMRKQGTEELNTIGDYLQGLQTSKRQLLSIIKRQILKLSQIFKQIQLKIENVYMSLRRNILIQSSLNTKLPTLIELMKTENNHDDFTIQNQFKKYCQLIKIKDKKLKISDKSKTIVEVFQEMPKKISEIIEKSTEEYKNKARDLLSTLDSENIEKKIISAEEIFKFSSQDKSDSIHVNQIQNQATGKENCTKSFVFVDKPFTKDRNKLIFKVGQNSSYELLVAIGNKKRMKECNYSHDDILGDEDIAKKALQIYFVSAGYTSKDQQDNEKDYSSSQQLEFLFNEPETQVQVTYLCEKKAIQFKNVLTGQQFQLQLKQDINNSQQWGLCFGINQKDKIILKQAK